MFNTRNKRKSDRFPISWSVYENYEDYDNKKILGYINDISQGGVGLIINSDYPQQFNFTLKIFPHPVKDTKYLELSCKLAWLNINNYFHNCGYHFVNLNSELKYYIKILIDKYKEVNRKTYLLPNQNIYSLPAKTKKELYYV